MIIIIISTIIIIIIKFKDNLYRKLDALNQTKTKWINHIESIV